MFNMIKLITALIKAKTFLTWFTQSKKKTTFEQNGAKVFLLSDIHSRKLSCRGISQVWDRFTDQV